MAANEFRRGWPALAAGFLGNAIGTHSLPPYTIGLFMEPLQREFGWDRTSISFGITILTLCGAFSAPVVGSVLPRAGAGFLIATGLACASIGYFALSMMTSSLVLYWILMAALALLGAGSGPVTLSFLLVATFETRRGTALGVSMMGIGLSGALAPVVLGHLIDREGWRAGYAALGWIMVAAAPVMVCLLVTTSRRFPVPMRRRVFQATEAPWRHPIFPRLAAAFLCVALASGGVVVHFVPMLVDAGFDNGRAAAAASLVGVSLVAGRIATGLLIDRMFAPAVASLAMTVGSVGFLALFYVGPEWTPLAAVLVGVTLGAELDLIAYLVSRYFPAGCFGRAVGMLFTMFLVGVALSPLAFGILRDLFGAYAPCLLWSSGLLAVSGVLFRQLPAYAVASDRGRALQAT